MRGFVRTVIFGAVLLLAAGKASAAAIVPAPRDGAHTITGDVRLIQDFPSAALGNSRTIAVYLPPGYDVSNDRYPVLYMQDGQNLFDAATAFGGNEWGIDETCERLIRSGELPPLIVVGIYNTDARIPEYTPVSDPQYGGGRGDLYGKFLIGELKPYIDSNLRTLADPDHTGIMGSSLGGLISLYLGLDRTGVFSRIGALSPSLWWAGGDFTKRLAGAPPAQKWPRVWIDMGTSEGDGQSVAGLQALGGVLAARGWRDGDDLAVRVIDGGSHNERSWSARAPDVLKFLFPASPRP